MQVDNVGVPNSAADTSSTRLGLTQEDFLKVLLAQLTYQDPLEPLDNKDFMAQLAQFANLEQSNGINQKLDSLLTFQSSNQAIGLIGKTVEVRADNGTVVGTVSSVIFQKGTPTVTIKKPDGAFLTDIGLGQITIVR